MQTAEDFRQESQALATAIEPLSPQDFCRPTQFKGWTIDDIMGHLHMFNVAAERTLESDAAFQAFFAPILHELNRGKTLLESQGPWLQGLAGPALFEAWTAGAERLADAYGKADPKQRVKWAGPDMSALSSITARQMETWAHGQAVFDVLGLDRAESDRIRNIAHLGVSTFGWTFINRKEPVPEPAPHVVLTGPSGAIWTWNDVQPDNMVRGSAVAFAQVVTQVRNVADTALQVQGVSAQRWMALAQCFAGQPVNPPVPGSRYKAAT
ncbi:TIGR03084 family protein [Hydrogenophaga crassostreae]|uniref:TIGR03084 family protein n=1 Tax=Hydrogenophaga crassostreae TaxID=1763535 RepID=A0A162PEH8_9BURK|nr:TIGR03084 family metal-binding protein [Hydrogenophaga crassostreae]AOW13780.1 TIGR03084 family protein [Hydrogenophaga crassostreae]OAD44257.1 TIGR03084 family protein [Hydrogenophaga crassostreae]